MATTVLLTGATGFVGRHMARALVDRGHRLRALVRDPESAETLRSVGADLVQGDVTQPESLDGVAEGCDAVIHLVGIIREKPPRVTFQGVHVEGTRNLLSAVPGSDVRRFVHMSALGAKPTGTPYHRTKHRAEEIVRGAGIPHVIFRPSTIAGAGSEFIGLLTRLVRLSPIVPVIGSGRYRLQPVDVRDVVEAFAQAVERDDLEGSTYEIGGPHKLTYNRLIEIVMEELGTSRPKLHVPLGLVRPVVEAVSSLRLPTPIDRNELAMLLEENVTPGDVNELRRTFGIEPGSLRSVLRRMREAGEI